jgi:hypothetical protein
MGVESIGGGAVVGQELEGFSVITPGATPAVNTTLGSIFTDVPAQNQTLSATNLNNGDSINLVVTTSGTTSYTLTFGTGFLTTGTLATGTVSGKVFVVSFIVQNNLLTETGRTTAM